MQFTPDGRTCTIVDRPPEPPSQKYWPVLERLLHQCGKGQTIKELRQHWPADAPRFSYGGFYNFLQRLRGKGLLTRTGSNSKTNPYRYDVASTAVAADFTSATRAGTALTESADRSDSVTPDPSHRAGMEM